MVTDVDPDLVLLCVPASAIGAFDAAVAPGPRIADGSGAPPVAALVPHERRFGVHPLRTFTGRRGAAQLDGAWGAVPAESEEARERGTWLATELGLRPFALREDCRV